jgi:hypothetical protein
VLIGADTRAPATVVSTRRVFGALDWLLYGVLAAVNVAAVVWLLRGALPHLDLASAAVILPSLAAVIGFEVRWLSLPLMRAPVPVPPVTGLRVAVVTTFVPAAEPLQMLRRSLEAMVAMDVAHDTWVLDEGDDEEVRALCADVGARHFTRRWRREYQQPSGRFEARTKHGNYNAWLDHVGFDEYDVVVAFDPDHLPLPAFLSRTLGYLEDPGVAFVQVAQTYYNQSASLVARGAAEETYAYYSSIQLAAFALGHPIVVGCHTTHRVAALRDIGGYAAHEGEDLLMTSEYRAAGWRGVYVPEVLAAGITPVDWPAYLTQQRRWARACADIKLRRLPRLASRLPLGYRVVSAFHGLYYLYALSAALGVVLLAGSLATGWAPEITRAGGAAPAIPILVATDLLRQRYYLDGRRERGLHVRASIVKFAKWPFVLLALWDAAFREVRGFAVTPKLQRGHERLLVRAHAPAAGLVVAGGVVGLAGGHVPSGAIGWLAAVYLAMVAGVVALDGRPAPAPYDDALAAAWQSRET